MNFSNGVKKILLFLLISLPVYLAINFYFLNRHYLLCPIDYPADIVIRHDSRGNGLFGAERSGNRKHQGIDLLTKIGTPVRAARTGRVSVAERRRGMGRYVVIMHRDNTKTIYGHLSEIYVVKGQFVRQGEVIGEVGKTGNANYRGIQPHLHFEVRKDNTPQDPLDYLE